MLVYVDTLFVFEMAMKNDIRKIYDLRARAYAQMYFREL